MADEELSDFDEMLISNDIPGNSQELLQSTQKLRWGLLKKHLKDSDDPKMLARLDSLMAGIDKQQLTLDRMSADKEEGAKNREVANEILALMMKNGNMTLPSAGKVTEPEIEDSGLDILDGELVQGDDILDSVID